MTLQKQLNYIILSEGCYSDYTPTYYRGYNILDQETLDGFAKKACLDTYKKADTFIKRPHYHNDCTLPYFCNKEDYYDDKTYVSMSIFLEKSFWEKLKKQVNDYGYEQIEPPTAEINIGYSDLPFTRKECGLLTPN